MTRYIELRRHAASAGDLLTEEGVRAALDIGRRLTGPYVLLVSSGAQRATQTLACFAWALSDPVSDGGDRGTRPAVGCRGSLACGVPDRRQRRAFRSARGSPGARARGLRASCGRAASRPRPSCRRPAGARGRPQPHHEAAVFGLTGELVAPMSKGAGVLVAVDGHHPRPAASPEPRLTRVALAHAAARAWFRLRTSSRRSPRRSAIANALASSSE